LIYPFVHKSSKDKSFFNNVIILSISTTFELVDFIYYHTFFADDLSCLKFNLNVLLSVKQPIFIYSFKTLYVLNV